MADRISVLIVDDSRLFRAALAEALGSESDIAVVGSVFSGEKAVEFVRAQRPDVVTLDVEMPGMDGLKTLEAIRQLGPELGGRIPGVIMVSAFTKRGAQVTIDALRAGAFDFVTKPSGGSAEKSIATLRTELTAKIRAWSGSAQRVLQGGAVRAPSPPPARKKAFVPGTARLVAIGASTGGPRALSTMLPELCTKTELPILIVQHMPTGFTRTFADSLGRLTGRTAVEAAEGMAVEHGKLYVAPGGKHLLVRGSPAAITASLTEQPPENGCRPAADVLFRSAAAVAGSGVVGIILTGMGRDGTAGAGAIRRGGGYVIAQDEGTSVVWGMPGSAVEAGVVDEVAPLEKIPAAVEALLERG